jgi:hypothetical protein
MTRFWLYFSLQRSLTSLVRMTCRFRCNLGKLGLTNRRCHPRIDNFLLRRILSRHWPLQTIALIAGIADRSAVAVLSHPIAHADASDTETEIEAAPTKSPDSVALHHVNTWTTRRLTNARTDTLAARQPRGNAEATKEPTRMPNPGRFFDALSANCF